jgi:hypothetical protein
MLVLLLLVQLLPARSTLRPIVPPDAESYQQCSAATNKTIAVSETVTFQILGDGSYTNTNARNPQKGPVLTCTGPNDSNYQVASYSNKWFTVNGTGNVLTASTCHNSTKIKASISIYQDKCITLKCANVYGPGGGCPGLCVGSTDKVDCGDSTVGSKISWKSDLGRMYHVQVWLYYSPIIYFGISSLKPCGGTVALSLSESVAPPNLDYCPAATPLLGADSPSTTANLTIILEQCSTDNSRQPGKITGRWYTVVGTGKIFKVAACEFFVDIFTGTSCGALTCMQDYTVHSSENCSQIIRFATAAAERYFVFISGLDTLNSDYELMVEEETKIGPAANDHCGKAEILPTDGMMRTLPLNGAVHSSVFPNVYFELIHDPSLWYSLEGTNNSITLEICGNVSMTMFAGNCTNGMQLYTFFPLFGPPINPIYEKDCLSFRFAPDRAKTYLLAIRSDPNVASTEGNVNMTAWEQNATVLPLNADCRNAFGPLAYNGSATTGTLLDVKGTSVVGKPFAHDLFYYANSTANKAYLHGQVCRLSGSAAFDVLLYETSLDHCEFMARDGTLVLPIDQNGCRSIFWKNQSGYYDLPLLIRVRGKEEMEFNITIKEEDASILPVNDQKPVLYMVNVGYTLDIGATRQGSTAHALSDYDFGTDFCSVDSNKPGIWYTITGTGQDLAVCLASAVNSTAKLAIVGELSNGDQLFTGCLPAAKYGYSNECLISVRWPTFIGDIYSLLVQTDGPEDFEVTLSNVTNGTGTQECVIGTLPPTFTPGIAPQTSPPSMARGNKRPAASSALSLAAGLFLIPSFVGFLPWADYLP